MSKKTTDVPVRGANPTLIAEDELSGDALVPPEGEVASMPEPMMVGVDTTLDEIIADLHVYVGAELEAFKSASKGLMRQAVSLKTQRDLLEIDEDLADVDGALTVFHEGEEAAFLACNELCAKVGNYVVSSVALAMNNYREREGAGAYIKEALNARTLREDANVRAASSELGKVAERMRLAVAGPVIVKLSRILGSPEDMQKLVHGLDHDRAANGEGSVDVLFSDSAKYIAAAAKASYAIVQEAEAAELARIAVAEAEARLEEERAREAAEIERLEKLLGEKMFDAADLVAEKVFYGISYTSAFMNPVAAAKDGDAKGTGTSRLMGMFGEGEGFHEIAGVVSELCALLYKDRDLDGVIQSEAIDLSKKPFGVNNMQPVGQFFLRLDAFLQRSALSFRVGSRPTFALQKEQAVYMHDYASFGARIALASIISKTPFTGDEKVAFVERMERALAITEELLQFRLKSRLAEVAEAERGAAVDPPADAECMVQPPVHSLSAVAGSDRSVEGERASVDVEIDGECDLVDDLGEAVESLRGDAADLASAPLRDSITDVDDGWAESTDEEEESSADAWSWNDLEGDPDDSDIGVVEYTPRRDGVLPIAQMSAGRPGWFHSDSEEHPPGLGEPEGSEREDGDQGAIDGLGPKIQFGPMPSAPEPPPYVEEDSDAYRAARSSHLADRAPSNRPAPATDAVGKDATKKDPAAPSPSPKRFKWVLPVVTMAAAAGAAGLLALTRDFGVETVPAEEAAPAADNDGDDEVEQVLAQNYEPGTFLVYPNAFPANNEMPNDAWDMLRDAEGNLPYVAVMVPCDSSNGEGHGFSEGLWKASEGETPSWDGNSLLGTDLTIGDFEKSCKEADWKGVQLVGVDKK